MNKFTVLLLGLSGFMAACQPDYQVRDQAIAVHDEIMPKMEPFVQTSMRIDTLLLHLDSLHAIHPDLDTLHLREELTLLRDQITTANDAMNEWMHGFEMEPQGNKETVENFFEQQKQQIDSVKTLYDQTEQAIEKQEFLK